MQTLFKGLLSLRQRPFASTRHFQAGLRTMRASTCVKPSLVCFHTKVDAGEVLADKQIRDMLSKEDSSELLKPEELPSEEEMKSREPEEGSELTYSQEYYILNREEILAKRREKELEARFGDFSARLVKRPKKNFMWGYGTQMHEEGSSEQHFFEAGQLPTIRQIINFLEVYQMKDIQVVNLVNLGFS